MAILAPGSVKKLLKTTNGRCGYCGFVPEQIHIDHVVPKSKGGTGSVKNLMVACYRCNILKRDKGLHKFNIELTERTGIKKFYFETIGVRKGQIYGPVSREQGFPVILYCEDVNPYEWEKRYGLD